MAAIAKQIRALDQGLVVNFAFTLDETIGDMTAGPRFNGILLLSFAAIALVMAIIGVYGVLTFTVTQRTHEIGVRIALGAARGRILGLDYCAKELRSSASVSLLGWPVRSSLTRYLKSILYGVSTTDPVTFMMVAAGLVVAALIAMSLPARKAASIDPIDCSLRHY